VKLHSVERKWGNVGCVAENLAVGSHKELGTRCPKRKVMPWVNQNRFRSGGEAVGLPGYRGKDVGISFEQLVP
jgi:hypothetical protein